eukprot:71641_1
MNASGKEEKLMQDAFDPPLPGSFTMFKKHGCLAMNVMGDIGPSFIDENTIKYLHENYTTTPNDVFIVTAPKSGTTWVQKICIEIMNAQKRCEIPKFKDGNWRHIVWMEAYLAQFGLNKFNEYIQQFKERNTLCFWKTHASFHLFPAKAIHPSTKLICVCRNPKDTVVSAFNFFRDEPATKFTGAFNHYLYYWMMGMLPFGNWFEYYSEWYRIYKHKKANYNILWVYYEDLQANPVQEIQRIARFIGKYDTLGNNDHERESKIEMIKQKSSFQNMKRMSETGQVDLGIMSSKFFRKGKVSDYKNFMTKSQSNTVDQMIRCKFYETDFRYYQDLKKESETPHLPLQAKL